MPTTRAQGLDLSIAQGNACDFAAIRAAGYDFVTLKVTEGAGYVDPAFERSAREARRVGLLVGGYHFQTTGSPIADQIASFAKASLGLLDLPPTIDFEAPTPEKWPPGAARRVFAGDLVKRALDAAQLTEAAFGRAMIYSFPFFLQQLYAVVGNMPELLELGKRPLWLAWYPHETRVLDDSEWPPILWPFGVPEFCQWSGDHGLAAPGVPSIVDHDLYRGTRADMLSLLIPTSESFPQTVSPTGAAQKGPHE